MPPVTQYTKSGDVSIAYQVFGSGDVDLVYVPGWISNLDWMWNCPELVNFFKELSKTVRIILFDKRGTGLSDRVLELSTLEERMDDIKAVMDAANSKKAILFGHSEGGSAAALFSVTYPDRVISLIAFGIFAKRQFTENYPWAPTVEERQKVYDMIENDWCNAEMLLENLAPSKANDSKFMNWLANYFRSGASPSAALKLTKMNTEVDIVDILEYIRVPTLLMHRTHDIDVKIEEGKFIANRIKGAKFIELEGNDHLFWIGNTKSILQEMKLFIESTEVTEKNQNKLISVVFGQFISSLSSGLKLDMVEGFVEKYGGEIINLTQKDFAIAFQVPGKAVYCSIALLNALKKVNTSLAMGIYIKEGKQTGIQSLDAKDLYTQRTMLSQLYPDEILVSQTVKHLLSGAGVNFYHRASVLNYNSNSLCKLYRVDEALIGKENEKVHNSETLTKHDYFLENVLQVVSKNLEDHSFNIELLSSILNMSQRQLQRKIKETTCKSPGQLINAIRLEASRKFLMSSDEITVSEVSFKYGFSSPSYFSKCFRKEFGVSPKLLNQKVK